MSRLDFISNFFRAFDIVKAVFALTLILMGAYVAFPNIFDSLASVESLYKTTICAGAGLVGLYLVYHALDTRHRMITLNELLAGAVGFLLIAFAVYVFFGQTLNYYLQTTTNWLLSLLPYVIASVSIILSIRISYHNPRSKAGYILGMFGVISAIILFLLQNGLLDIIKKALGI